MISGGLGMVIGVALCTAVNTLATLPCAFSGMIITWPNALLALAALVADRHRLVDAAGAPRRAAAAHRSAPLRDVSVEPDS